MPTKTRNHLPRIKNGNIELLLTEHVDNLGEQGEIVTVKPGYARNFLIPRGLATVATPLNKMRVETHKKRQEELLAKKRKVLRDLANAVGKYSVTIEANAQADGTLYGSINEQEIAKSLQNAGFDVTPNHVKLEGPLRELGMYTVRLQFDPEVETAVKVWAVPAAGSMPSKR